MRLSDYTSASDCRKMNSRRWSYAARNAKAVLAQTDKMLLQRSGALSEDQGRAIWAIKSEAVDILNERGKSRKVDLDLQTMDAILLERDGEALRRNWASLRKYLSKTPNSSKASSKDAGTSPPRKSQFLLDLVLTILDEPSTAESKLGDLQELFVLKCKRHGSKRARTWYVVAAFSVATRAIVAKLGKGALAAFTHAVATVLRRGG